jgi:hypothetical protein
MAFRLRSLGLGCGMVWSALVGCGGDSGVKHSPGASGGDGGTGNGGSTSTTGGTLNVGNTGNTAGSGATGGTGLPMGNCGSENCGLGQRCETNDDDEQSCVDNECGDLDCTASEECQPAPGGGNYCADISCEGDVDCPINRFCDGDICVDDACVGGSATCDGDSVIVCAQNGGSEAAAPYTCGGGGYYTSTCDDTNPDATGCSCQDDWDCPEFTACEGGVCVGTGEEPTCTLDVQPFENLLPAREFHWGGASEEQPATGSPFSWSAQSASTPVVINLDDDNGDGKADERDFPEIVFLTYHSSPHLNGIVRAIHGGGPNKGTDYFALCGDQHWIEGDTVIDDCDASAGDADSSEEANLRASQAAAAGDIDGDGFPEIVVTTVLGGIRILNNRGEPVLTSAEDLFPLGGDANSGNDWRSASPAIANLDFTGLAEIVVGNRVIMLTKNGDDFEIAKVFTGEESTGTQMQSGNDPNHHGPIVCVADLTADTGMEIVAGTTAYRIPTETACPDVDSDWCADRLSVVWDAYTIDQAGDALMDADYQEGFCAVADVLGVDPDTAPGPTNLLDGKPEVIVVSEGHLLIIDGDDGELQRLDDLGGGALSGGAPNVDDFDGDGFPEIATATEEIYTVFDLQAEEATNCPAWDVILDASGAPPQTNAARTPGATCDEDTDCNAGAVCNERLGQCVCLHNGWKRDTEDDSSRVTSSSVFDFNGDGAAEVVYNDECYFRVYEGGTGLVYLQIPSLSRTIIENPVVADVDNDGNAEIIFINNNETIQCSEGNLDSWPAGNNDVDDATLPNGIDVWGDPSDQWVAARRIWNQNSYHVTNVTEGGTIPLHEPESWKPLNGRLYNTYRSQPRNYNVAPDLALTAIQISSPDVACGQLSDTIQIVIEVVNQGDLRVGPGVVMEFIGTWDDPDLEEALEDDNGDPISVVLDKSLEPGSSTLITVTYDKGSNGRDDFPVTITAIIDGDDTARECIEDNNSIDGDVEPGAEVADLRVEIDTNGTDCGSPEIDVTVYNDGSADAEDVLVYIYAGDPSQGGTLLGETTIEGPIGAGDSAQATVELGALSLDVTIYAVVDPLNSITECNDGNNIDEGPFLDCDPGVR